MQNAVPVKLHEIDLGKIRNPLGFAGRHGVKINGSHQDGYDRRAQNPEQNRTAYLEYHQYPDQEQADKRKLNIGVFQAAQVDYRFKRQDIGKFVSRDIVAGFDADRHQSAIFQTDNRNEQTDPYRNRMLQSIRNRLQQHLPDVSDRKQDENQTGDEYGRQAHFPSKGMIRRGRGKHYRGKVSVQTHTWCESYWEVNKETHCDRKNASRKSCRQKNRIPAHVDLAKCRKRVGVDRQDVSHGHKGCKAGHNLRTNRRTILFQLKKPIHDSKTPPYYESETTKSPGPILIPGYRDSIEEACDGSADRNSRASWL
ncbi:hypothetical protein D1872_233270 [compost metagenome]